MHYRVRLATAVMMHSNMKATSFKKIAYYFLIIFGAFGFWGEIDSIQDVSNLEPISGVTAAVSVIVLGGLGLKSVEINYRGGAPSVIGCILVVLGFFTFAQKLDELFFSEPERIFIGFTAGFLLLSMGIILLRSGHKYHKLQGQFESDST